MKALVLALALLLSPAVLWAQEAPAPDATQADGVYLPRADAADAFSRVEEAETLKRKVSEQEQQIAALKQIIALKDEIAGLQAQKFEKQAELTALAEKKADYWQGRVADVEKGAKKDVRNARVMGFAGAGAAIGAVAPPFGPLVGAAIGAAIGFFSSEGP